MPSGDGYRLHRAFWPSLGFVVGLLLMPSPSVAVGPAAPFPTLTAPFQGTWSSVQSTSLGNCGGTATIPVAPSANLSVGDVTVRVRTSSNCSSLVMGGRDYSRGRVQLTIANWTSNASGSSVANVSLRADLHVRLHATRSAVFCFWPASAFAEVEIDNVYVLDVTSQKGYFATASSGFTNSTTIVGTANYSALDHLRIGFQIPMTVTAHHQCVLGLRVTATVETTSCGPGSSSSAILDAARFGHEIRIVSVQY